MQSLIVRADAWLKASRPDYYAKLRPGVDDAALDAYQARFGLALPIQFREIYRWRDGQDLGADARALVHNHMFMPLSESATSKELLDGMIGADFDNPAWWRRGWVPFTLSFGGDHYCVDLEAEAGPTRGQIIDFWQRWRTHVSGWIIVAHWFRELVVDRRNKRQRPQLALSPEDPPPQHG